MDYFHFIGHFFPVSCHLPDPLFWCPLPWHLTSLPTKLPAFTLTPILCSPHSRSCDPFVKTIINPITILQCYSVKKKILNLQIPVWSGHRTPLTPCPITLSVQPQGPTCSSGSIPKTYLSQGFLLAPPLLGISP